MDIGCKFDGFTPETGAMSRVNIIRPHRLHMLLWLRGVMVSVVGLINEVNQHRARLVLGWVTVLERVNHLGM